MNGINWRIVIFTLLIGGIFALGLTQLFSPQNPFVWIVALFVAYVAAKGISLLIDRILKKNFGRMGA